MVSIDVLFINRYYQISLFDDFLSVMYYSFKVNFGRTSNKNVWKIPHTDRHLTLIEKKIITTGAVQCWGEFQQPHSRPRTRLTHIL